MAIGNLNGIHGITKLLDKREGGILVADQAHDAAMSKLISKVQQHEKTIAQLVEIIGATNCRISELSLKQKERDKSSCLPS